MAKRRCCLLAVATFLVEPNVMRTAPNAGGRPNTEIPSRSNTRAAAMLTSGASVGLHAAFEDEDLRAWRAGGHCNVGEAGFGGSFARSPGGKIPRTQPRESENTAKRRL